MHSILERSKNEIILGRLKINSRVVAMEVRFQDAHSYRQCTSCMIHIIYYKLERIFITP